MACALAMPVLAIRASQTAHPTGDPNFAVMQPFPAAFEAEEADPFLMCDEIGPLASKGEARDEDSFPVDWHPHLGMDIMSYFKQGRGRHADSLGNRGLIPAPGFQWMSVGSGVEHAEGGGTPAGQPSHGFQIWINVPRALKDADPRYGTVLSDDMVDFALESGGNLRLMAGEHEGRTGPFKTAGSVLMMDLELPAGAQHKHTLPRELDNCLVYMYKGSGLLNGQLLASKKVARLDGSDPELRDITLEAGDEAMGALVFAGKMLKEPIAWHGPFVMTSKAELRKAFEDYRSGRFPPKRVPWDYRRAAAAPKP